MKPIALAQADLYCFFFRRPEKRVQLLWVGAGKILTIHEPLNRYRALETLNRAWEVYRGARPKPPKPWKCKRCKYSKICKIHS